MKTRNSAGVPLRCIFKHNTKMSNPVFAPERRTLSAPTVWFKISVSDYVDYFYLMFK